MEVKLKEITINDLVENYKDNSEEGVTGYNDKLDIRPPYQREFVYNDIQQKAVIDTVIKRFPLNVMYWAVRDDNEKPYEIIDGQQQLTLISNKKLESLKLELEEKESETQIDEGINKEEMKKDEKKKWWQFFR